MVGSRLSGCCVVGCWVEVCCVGGRLGAMGVAGMLEVGEWLVVLVENLDGTFDCPLKALELWSILSKLEVRLLIL